MMRVFLLIGCALIGVGNVLVAFGRGDPWEAALNTVLVAAIGAISIEWRHDRER